MKANVLKALSLPSRFCDDHLSSEIEEFFPELSCLQTTNNLKLYKSSEVKEKVIYKNRTKSVPFCKIGSKCNCEETLVEMSQLYEIRNMKIDNFLPTLSKSLELLFTMGCLL